jgi:hypothetical protein
MVTYMKVPGIAAVFVLLTIHSFGQQYKKLMEAIDRQDQQIATNAIAMAPTIDLSQDTTRQVVVARGTDSIYQGHVTTVLLPNGKSILAVWTINHAGFCGPMKRSDDGGRTWSKLLPVPESWHTVKNCPAIYNLPAPSGKKTLFVFAGAGRDVNQMEQSYSTDLGVTWSPMKPNGLGPASMPFCTIVPVNNGKKLIAMTNIRRPNEKVEKKSCIIVESESSDGGFTWKPWKIVLDVPGLKVCEPQIIRSPNGKQLLCLIRDNARRTSLYMTSDDEGNTWSEPKPVPFGLSGDRHQAKYTADGRLVIVFRDTGKGSPTRNHFVAWVGAYEDIIQNRKGQFRIKLLHSYKGGDCGYAGLEVLPDRTIVATTYIKYREGTEKNSVVSTRFNLAECAALLHDGVVECVPSVDVAVRNKYYVANKQPLTPNPLIQLAPGSIQPKGWLNTQIDLMSKGMTGHLDEISKYLDSSSGWLGGSDKGWEEAPYWLRGYYVLAQISPDSVRLKKIANKWIDAIIRSQQTDGYYGSKFNRLVKDKNTGAEVVDLWPHMAMNDALISHYEATKDKRIIPMMTRFFAFCRDLPDSLFLRQVSWMDFDFYSEKPVQFASFAPLVQNKRAGDFIPQLLWLYNHTGEQWMIDLAIKIYHKALPEMNEWLDRHTVNFAERFRYAAEMYPITGDARYLHKTEMFYNTFVDVWGQMPRGAYAADERIRAGKLDPRQAIETCSLIELNKSHYILSGITGNTQYADRIEDITFNHLPASHAPDLRSLRYLTACNMVYSVPAMDFRNKALQPVFAADLHRCCQHNSAGGWPWFVENCWQATPDNGLICWLYAPNEVTATVGEKGTVVKINTATQYPFDETVSFKLSMHDTDYFPLYFRIPGWCKEAKVTIGGKMLTFAQEAGKLVKIKRTWKDGDAVVLQFSMNVAVTQWPRNGALSVDRGPLTYSVRIKEDWKEEPGGTAQWPRWSVSPASPWNYGLAIDPDSVQKAIKVEVAKTVSVQPWKEADAPVVLHVPAKRIADWQASISHTVDAVRESPVRSDAPLEMIEMIPMGCSHLRLTVLPLISDRADARYWKDIPDPEKYMYSSEK